MKSFWSQFLNAALGGALQGGSTATQNNSNIKTTGITMGIGALAGILQFFLQHPFTAAPAMAVTTSIKVNPPTA